ncbi:MAG: hypothetical protein KAX80_05660 [Planctomycetes bacterium]|nr:hypothetical protein [Planctomycetota bacterium]
MVGVLVTVLIAVLGVTALATEAPARRAWQRRARRRPSRPWRNGRT